MQPRPRRPSPAAPALAACVRCLRALRRWRGGSPATGFAEQLIGGRCADRADEVRVDRAGELLQSGLRGDLTGPVAPDQDSDQLAAGALVKRGAVVEVAFVERDPVGRLAPARNCRELSVVLDSPAERAGESRQRTAAAVLSAASGRRIPTGSCGFRAGPGARLPRPRRSPRPRTPPRTRRRRALASMKAARSRRPAARTGPTNASPAPARPPRARLPPVRPTAEPPVVVAARLRAARLRAARLRAARLRAARLRAAPVRAARVRAARPPAGAVALRRARPPGAYAAARAPRAVLEPTAISSPSLQWVGAADRLAVEQSFRWRTRCPR